MSWLKKILPNRATGSSKSDLPEGVWIQCAQCQAALYRPEFEKTMQVCSQCSHHHRLPARTRLEGFLDEGSFEEIAQDVVSKDFLKFKDSKKYKDRISAACKKTAEKEALMAAAGTLKGMPIVACAFEFGYIGGSMGYAVGERFVRAASRSLQQRAPFICFTSSGGARMQEGVISLMQMSKTSAAIARLREESIPYIVVLTDPTTGGVSASLAMLGDVIIAEPDTLVGFTGPRVIEQTIKQALPDGFQRSQFLLDHGHIDCIVERSQMREAVFGILDKLLHPRV